MPVKKSTGTKLKSLWEDMESNEVVPLLADVGVGNGPDLTTEVPQGRHLGIFSTLVLFVSRMVGSGIFATPSSIYVNTGGNLILYFTIWTAAALSAYAGLYIFLEFGSSMPRSGGRKLFLETAYSRPHLMMSVTFSCFSVLTGFAVSNSIVFGKYFAHIIGASSPMEDKVPTPTKYFSIAIVLLVAFIHGTSVRIGVRVQNFLGSIKLVLILLMCFAGIYTLLWYNRSEWESAFTDNTPVTPVSYSSIASAFISAFFCFSGWDSVHSVASEIKNPARTLQISGSLSILICFICYTMMNIAYLRVLTYDDMKQAGPLVGSFLFTKLFGSTIGGRMISMVVATSAASNIFVVLYGISRMNQEVFREGYLPFSKFFSSNWPFDAPLPGLSICVLLTIGWLVVVPSEGPSFDYLVNMEGYGNQVFLLLIAVGIFFHRRKNDTGSPTIRASNIGVISIILVSIYLVVAPFVGNQNANTISILPPYEIMALITIFGCFLYWLVCFVLLPALFNYDLTSSRSIQDDGLIIYKWIKTYK